MTGKPETVSVPHLGGSTISYKFGKPYDPSLPTLVMINSFTTSMELYRAQFADSELMAAMNVLAIEPYGHGATRATWQQFTYWDSAIADLQVLEALGIPDAFVLGTSQGGWIAARMAMLAPTRSRASSSWAPRWMSKANAAEISDAGTAMNLSPRRSTSSPPRSATIGWSPTTT